ncbi:hypothetical protein [Clostridium perfringens]|uniref:hypothetical protein n=1 Tax=Clostridium perfringens TaxID=1502 RepID=UPI002341EA6B|nr:hypothetical protein [Clostridium perfringens]MDC4245608.1 hypothetical protein [Clostridium perfringens]
MKSNLLKIDKGIIHKYRTYVKGNEAKSILEIRKLLTRNFILGEEIWTDDIENVQARMFGNLKIIVDLEEYKVKNIYNNLDKVRNIYINQLEKEALNKALEIVA